MKDLIKKNIILFISLFIINIISILNLYVLKINNNSYSNYMVKQSIWIIIGYILIILLYKINIKKLINYSRYFYYLSIILLILVLFLGKDINGAKCWFNILGLSFQPSELVKLSLVLYLSYQLNIRDKYTEFKYIITLIIIVLIPSILVFLEPDTGAIFSFLLIFIIYFFYSKLSKKWYIIFFLSCLLGMGFIIYLFIFSKDLAINIFGTNIFYRIDRLINFAKGSNYQLENALITIGSSQLVRNGFNKINLYIPEAHTDFFFAFSIGNFGLLCGIIELLMIIILDITIIMKISNSKLLYYKQIASAFLAMLIFQQYYNIFMNIGLLPIMGIPLPFLSYGGTNIIINYIFLGLITNNYKKLPKVV